MTRLFLSDRLDILATALSEELVSDGYPPLHPRTIILPNHQLKNWLTIFLAKIRPLVACRIYSVQEIIRNRSAPTQLEMFGSIYSWLKKSQEEELCHYLKGKEKRIIELSDHLRELVFSYAQFGIEDQGEENWQRSLLREIPWNFSPQIDVKGPVHCFGCDYLPQTFWDALSSLSPLTVYLFSPCVHFWEDLCTHWEKKKLIRKSHPKSRDQLEFYLSETPPLLANWGKLGRETLKILDSFDFEVEEYYSHPEKKSALKTLQRNLLFMESSPLAEDSSIRVFQTGCSQLREIEILKENIEEMAKRGIPFSEMAVFAPNINDYVPLIEFVFEKEIPYRILNVEVGTKSHFLQGLSLLLSDTPFEVFENPSFCRKQNWDQKKLNLVRQWKEKGIDRILEALMYLTDTEISWSDTDLLEEMVEKWVSIQSDLPIEEKSCGEWAEYLERIAKTYLVSDEMGEAPFQSLLNELRKARLSEKFSVQVIRHWLKRSSQGAIHGSSLHAISFGSLQQGALFPARALFLIGMDEEQFPRKQFNSSLNLLKKREKFIPQSGDVDRYLMLQALFFAKDYFYFSYAHLSGDEGKPIGPSLVLQELLSELKNPWVETAPPIKTYGEKKISSDFFRLELPFSELPRGEITVSISDLAQLARHPWEFYLHKTLGITLEKKKIDSFPLQKSWFAKETLQKELESSLRDQLPPGLVGKAQEGEIEKTAKNWQKLLKEWNLEIQTWSLLESCREKKRVSSERCEWPALEIAVNDSLTVKITGDLKMMSEEGLVTTGDDFMRVWPEWLVGAVVSQSPRLYLLKKGKIETIEKPKEALCAFLVYYFRSLSHPSPLIAPWSDFFLKGKKKEKSYYEDPIYDWVLSRVPLPPDEKFLEKWNWIKETFSYAAV